MNRTLPLTLLIVVALALAVGALLGPESSVTARAQGQPGESQKDEEKKLLHFSGSKDCKRCHFGEYKAWKLTPHAQAFDVPAPNARAEAKKKAKLDPAKDYRTDKKCVVCHTVGLGHKGGYELGTHEKQDKSEVRAVGCESCHGPGEDLLSKGRKDRAYKANQAERLPALVKLGYVPKPDKKTCTTCHNESSPTWPGSFDYEKMKEKGSHKTPKR
mgnify:CR=1 FL=1